MLQVLIRRQVALKVLNLGVVGRTRRHVLVHGRHLLVPTDTHARPLRDRGLELHPEHPGRARRHGVPVALPHRLLFRDDDLKDQVVVDGEAGRRVDVADRVRVVTDAGHELEGNFAALGVVIRFPAVSNVAAADGARVFV